MADIREPDPPEPASQEVPYSLLRDAIAVLLVAIACPIAVYGGSAAGCIGAGGFESACALNGVWIAPLMLVGAGLVAGLITRGWTGLFLVCVGTVIGMMSILVISFLVGRPVPVDPVSAFIATVWFLAPVAIGYGLGRVAWRVYLATRRTA
ncbi:MAG TPA: hypothetical protein VFY23_12720 [Candidatus Limnocylindrales bacterium]|nr:hypothetical protein [Candidatus Limnocylindrales bacterium]